MLYLDTSMLLPLFVPEPESAPVRAWLEARAQDVLAISDWTMTEFAGALGIMVRQKDLKADQARKAWVLMRETAAESLEVLTPTRSDYGRAAEHLAQFGLGLRAGDALHLSVAENQGAECLYTLDRRLIAAARKLQFKAASPTA